MSLVKLEDVSRQFRTEPIWQGINLNIEPGERLGIIGANGCGKSSLLRVIANLDKPDSGRAYFRPNLSIGWLEQNPQFDPSLNIRETIKKSQIEINAKIKEYENICDLYSQNPTAINSQRMERLNSELSAIGAWDLSQRTEELLSSLKLHNISSTMGELSQGTRKKVAICIALLHNPELLILDEPTNHLDTLTIDWLEQQITLFKGSIVLVTHDRYFLDRTVQKILELDRGSGTLYEGNYAQYLEEKAHFVELKRSENERLQNLIHREMEWFKRGARARSTKQKARQERLQSLLEEEEKQKNLLSQRSEISLHSVSNFQYLGTKGINLCNINKSFADKSIIDDFSLKICRGDRLGFVGPNGCGKSTLLNIIAETLLPDNGHVEYGETVRLGYYAQNSDALNGEDSIIDYVREGGDFVYTQGRRVSAESLLEQFLFPRPIQHNLIKKLSGGEQKRLRLLRLLMQNPNCLLLDEPTNDLDIPTLIRLESWLDDFPGIVIIVSHDRYFLDRCADRLFYFSEGKIKEFIGDYATLRQHINESAQNLQTVSLKQTEKKLNYTPSPKKNKPTYKQTVRFKAIEEEIALKEKRQAEIQALLETPGSINGDLDSLCSEFQRLKEDLEELLSQWEELAELM